MAPKSTYSKKSSKGSKKPMPKAKPGKQIKKAKTYKKQLDKVKQGLVNTDAAKPGDFHVVKGSNAIGFSVIFRFSGTLDLCDPIHEWNKERYRFA